MLEFDIFPLCLFMLFSDSVRFLWEGLSPTMTPKSTKDAWIYLNCVAQGAGAGLSSTEAFTCSSSSAKADYDLFLDYTKHAVDPVSLCCPSV